MCKYGQSQPAKYLIHATSCEFRENDDKLIRVKKKEKSRHDFKLRSTTTTTCYYYIKHFLYFFLFVLLFVCSKKMFNHRTLKTLYPYRVPRPSNYHVQDPIPPLQTPTSCFIEIFLKSFDHFKREYLHRARVSVKKKTKHEMLKLMNTLQRRRSM